MSCDQLVANQIGGQTRFPSLEVGLEDARQAGDCDSGYSCAYTNNLAWKNDTQPLPPMLDPRALFERLFGDGAELGPEARARRQIEAAQPSRLRDRRHTPAAREPRPHRSAEARRVPDLDSSDRGTARACRQRGHASIRASTSRTAFPRFRRALQADDRHDHGGVPGGPDARRHVPRDARGYVTRLSRDRHRRRPSSADPPSECRRADGQGGDDQPLPRRAVRQVDRHAQGGRRGR